MQLLAVNHWNKKANFGGEARHRASAFTIGERGYIGMGHVNSAEHIIYKDISEYDPATKYRTQKVDFIGRPRTSAVSFVNNDKAYLVTSHTYSLALDDFYEFIPSSNQWTQEATLGDTLRPDATGFAFNNEGYLGKGNNLDGSIN